MVSDFSQTTSEHCDFTFEQSKKENQFFKKTYKHFQKHIAITGKQYCEKISEA